MRLKKQMDFIKKLDWMKTIIRKTKLVSCDRYENDAEHTFHILAMTYILKEYAPETCDRQRVMDMLLFHDVVEIEAGDTFAYDKNGHKSKWEREKKAAENLFGILPEEQYKSILDLWIEFEKQETIESKFALAMDRIEPIYLNALNNGGSWKENNIPKQDILERIDFISNFSPELYEFTLKLINSHFSH